MNAFIKENLIFELFLAAVLNRNASGKNFNQFLLEMQSFWYIIYTNFFLVALHKPLAGPSMDNRSKKEAKMML